MFEKLKKKGFQILALHHAEAILKHDMADAVTELERVLLDVQIPVEELIRGGGGEGELTQRIRRALADDYGWKKHNFEIKKIVDGEEKESVSHEIDHVKRFPTGTFVLEIEWNNKDPFFDRDLNNFRLLFDLRVMDVGVIITRSTRLQDTFRALGREVAAKYGASTTHMEKLLPRLEGGGGGGCPVLAFGITTSKYVEDAAPIVEEDTSDGDDSE